jgi:nucleotide-binding universal stress UspA family protein
LRKTTRKKRAAFSNQSRALAAGRRQSQAMKNRDFKNILVPVDFSGGTKGAIETAQELGRRSGAAIHLVHVDDYIYPVGFIAPGAPVPMSMITFRNDNAERIRKELDALSRKFGIPAANCYLRSDHPVFNGVCKVAKQIEADLIVLQTHGRTGFTRFFEGSHAERIVQHSPCPVLVARKRTGKAGRPSGAAATTSIDSILVPVDFSQCSFEALEYAIGFAERVAARLIVFHAVYIDYAYTADGYAMADLTVLIDRARIDAEREMQEFVRLAKFRSVQFETVVTLAPPGPDICGFAEKRDVDLIITATHGRTGLKHLLMGSVAEHVVRHARQPVLVVPSHPETRLARLTRETRSDQRSMAQPATRQTKPDRTRASTKRDRKLVAQAFPERRRTNKFRESHARKGR